MSQPIFNQVCLDPTLITGIYGTCDQWCMYCPATERCLAYRCSPEIRSGSRMSTRLSPIDCTKA